MYVRWIVRGHKSDQANITFHDAYLVESYRDDNGDPRQRTLAYLGNIREIDDGFPVIERELFLLRAELLLSKLELTSPADAEHILGLLHRKVPPLDVDEMNHGLFATLRWYCKWWSDNAEIPSESEFLSYIEQAKDVSEQALRRYFK